MIGDGNPLYIYIPGKPGNERKKLTKAGGAAALFLPLCIFPERGKRRIRAKKSGAGF